MSVSPIYINLFIICFAKYKYIFSNDIGLNFFSNSYANAYFNEYF